MSQGPRWLDALRQRPLLLDAAMGTRLIARGLDLKTNDPCLWCLDRPDEVVDVHRRDVAAGTDAVLTNTFGANRKWLARFGREGDAAAINRRAVELAREAVGPERFVLGSIGPSAVDDENASLEQATTLVEAGIDALILETYTCRDAKAQVERFRAIIAAPVIVSLSQWGIESRTAPRSSDHDRDRTETTSRESFTTAARSAPTARPPASLPPCGGGPGWGVDVRASAPPPTLPSPTRGEGMEHPEMRSLDTTPYDLLARRSDIAAFGSNCLNLSETLQVAEWLHSRADVLLIAKPSAGLPGEEMTTPEEFAAAVRSLIALGVRLIGGCCGTTEAHVAAMRRAIDELLAESRDDGAVVG